MAIKYNEFGEVISVNGLTTGQHLGTPMQDAKAELPEHNQAYNEEVGTVTRVANTVEDAQPEASGGMPVLIDLDEMRISEAILPLFAQNGGSIELDDSINWQPWDVLNTGKPVTVHFTLAGIDTEFYSANTTVLHLLSEGKAHGLGFEVTVCNEGAMIRVSVFVERYLQYGLGTYHNEGGLHLSVRPV